MLPALPLQLVLRAHPDWREDPVVVVEDDRPLARILWANRPARRQRIRRGLRFSEARSLVARLRAVPAAEIDVAAAVEEVLRELLSFSPRVEPAAETPGVFWVDPRGLGRLYAGPAAWGTRVHRRLEARGLVASVALGWRRPGLLAVALSAPGVRVLTSPEEEEREADCVPLARLELPPDLRQGLSLLGVETLGEFRRLPAAGIAVRFGVEAAALHDFACGLAWTPFRACLPERPLRADIDVEPPDDDRHRLLFAVKGALHGMARSLRARSHGILSVELRLHLDHAPRHDERIETAAPTLDVARLIDLVRLRLASVELAAPVERMEIEIGSRAVSPRQMAVLDTPPPRDPAAAAAALARVKAAFGPASVVRARLVDAHLPERRVRWEPVSGIVEPHPDLGAAAPLPLVRTLLPAPRALPDPPRHEREAWLGRHGAVEAMFGPDRVGDGWWSTSAERDYYFVETSTGSLLWVYHDRLRRAWYLHGFVD